MRYCCIRDCKISKEHAKNAISFHTFPREQTMKEAWLKAIGDNYVSKAWPLICSRHFAPGLIDVHPGQRPMLRKAALPTIFPNNKKLAHTSRESSTMQTAAISAKININAAQSLKDDLETSLRMTIPCVTPDCSVQGCNNAYTNLYPFPSKNDEIRSKWATLLCVNVTNIDTSFRICDQHFTANDYCTKLSVRSLSLTAIPSRNLPLPDDTLIKLEPIQYDYDQFDDPLADPLESETETVLACNNSISTATQVNWPGDAEFRFDFLDTLTTDRDLQGWTGLTSFDCLQSLVQRIPNGESVAATYGVSLRNLIVMVLVRTKMNIPFEQLTVLFPMKTTTLTKCFTDFLPILEAATSSSIPTARATGNVNEAELLIERPAIVTNVGGKVLMIRKITTSKTAIRIDAVGLITAIVPVSGKAAETSQSIPAGGKSLHRRSDLTNPTISFSMDLTQDDDVMMAELDPPAIQSATPKKVLLTPLKRSIPTVNVPAPVIALPMAPDTIQCKQTIQRIKSFKILYDKVAPSMALYMDPIVRLVCGVINFNKANTKCSDHVY